MRAVRIAATCLTCFALVAPTAQATFPGANGKLVMSMGPPGLGTVNPDGTGLTRLTTGIDSLPAWSADGRRIAFRRFTFGRGEELWVMDADGTNQRLVRPLEPDDTTGGPAWSPGSEIALTRIWGDVQIVAVADGSVQRVLRPPGSPDVLDYADWAPGGSDIVTVGSDQIDVCDPTEPGSVCDIGYTDGVVYRIAADGSAITHVPISSLLGSPHASPSWSPDGDELALSRLNSNLISIVPATGGTTREIAADASEPVWSPDGTKLAYAGAGNQAFGDIYTINADGSGITRILDGGPGAGVSFNSPSWQPRPNRAPDCSSVTGSPNELWPPNKKLRAVTLSGARDPDGDAVSLEVTAVRDDESSGTGSWRLQDADAVMLRAQRDPRGDGRTYTVSFEATDAHGASCTATAAVSVPRHKG